MSDDTLDGELFESLNMFEGDLISPAAAVDIDGLKLVCTCNACPEQYDVFGANGKKVGYLRLRHGFFRAEYPDCLEETVYEAHPRGDGLFEPDEREMYLKAAVAALKKRIAEDTGVTNAY
jgi:hypothetical protein